MQLHTGHCINISNKFHGDSLLLAFAAAQLPGLEDLPRVTWSLDAIQCVSLKSIAYNSLSPWKLSGNIQTTDPLPPKSPVSGFLIAILGDLLEGIVPQSFECAGLIPKNQAMENPSAQEGL